MIGLDTNVLARYYVDDNADPEAEKQRPAARRLIESGEALMIAKTVLLEFEWVLRGYYRFEREQVQQVFAHLLSLTHVRVEAREEVERALENHRAGFDFADALHLASYRDCTRMATFDDRGLVRRAKRLGLKPGASVPR